MNNLPYVVAICPTYARFPERGWLVGEAVQSFLSQDYPADRRQLIVYNDCPEQDLDLPGAWVVRYGKGNAIEPGNFHIRQDSDLPVTIVNRKERYATLGEKYNAAVQHYLNTCYQWDKAQEVWWTESRVLVAPWEDDDISLPHRLSLSVEKLGSASYFNPRSYFYMPARGPVKWERRAGYAHNCSVFRLEAWRQVDGYPHDCKQDAGMDSRLRLSGLPVVDGPLTPEETFFAYRWGVSDHHVSAYPDPEAAYLAYGRKPVFPGCFEIKPHWREDYVALARAAGGQAGADVP